MVLVFIGLTVGYTCSIFMIYYFLYEINYDHYHQNKDRIYRVISEHEEYEVSVPLTSIKLGPALQNDLPEIDDFVRIYTINNTWIKHKEDYIPEEFFVCADPTISNIFTIDILEGNKQNLITPGSVIISERMKNKYFPLEDPVGKYIEVKTRYRTFALAITGVFKDLPPNSTFKANFITHFHHAREHLRVGFEKNGYPAPESWVDAYYQTYILLKRNTNIKHLSAKLPDFSSRHLPEFLMVNFKLQPLLKIYFESDELVNNNTPQGKKKIIYTLLFVAFMILIVASVNYVIFSIANGLSKIKEIGIKKTFGATKQQLQIRLFGESIMISVFCLLLSILIISLLIPVLRNDFQLDISPILMHKPLFWILIFILSCLIGIVAGGYTSVYLLKQPANSILSGNFRIGGLKTKFLNYLLLFQIVIFSGLIVSTLIINKQIRFSLDRELGFDKKSLLVLEGFNKDNIDHLESFKHYLLSSKNILKISGALSPSPPSKLLMFLPFYPASNPENKLLIDLLYVDYEFIETLQLELIEGRSFSEEYSDDMKNVVIINKQGVKDLGLTDPVGERLDLGDGEIVTIIGVIEDFCVKTIHERTRPLLLYVYPNSADKLYILVSSSHASEALKFIRNSWYLFLPSSPFTVMQYEDAQRKQYSDEFSLLRILVLLTIIAILLSCFGLYSIIQYTSSKKLKEIAIRKVFGASVENIFFSLLKSYMFLVIMGTMIAVFISNYLVNRWLDNFAYTPKVTLIPYLETFLLTLFIVFGTLVYQIIKASRTKPVVLLHYE